MGQTQEKEQPKAGFLQRLSRLSLSAKLLLLTILFVMLAEILIFVPSVANFRKNFLMERLSAAQIAALAVEAAPDQKLPRMLRDELLRTAQVHAVALRRADSRRLVLAPAKELKIDDFYDLRKDSAFTLIKDALLLFFQTEPRLIRVTGHPNFGAGQLIEIVINEAPCREAILQFGLRILWLSVVISVMSAALVYLALNALLVRPMMQITRSMVHFGENPEDRSRIIVPSTRGDEVGVAERELAKMQSQLSDTLKQKSHLAALGLAVSKINHDLRNMLASAQLVSDRFSDSQDPQVQRFAPRLINALDRAIRLCTDTLKYGQASEPKPLRTIFPLAPLLDEIADSLELTGHQKIEWKQYVPSDLKLNADRDMIYRVLMNLCRNSVQVLENEDQLEAYEISVTAEKLKDDVLIDVCDSGPGLPILAREHLFDPFKGSSRKGGTGLGLAISAELIKAHQGKIELLTEGKDGSKKGTVFRITLPCS